MCYEQLQLVWLLVLGAGMVVNLAVGLVETRQYTTGLLKLFRKTGCVLNKGVVEFCEIKQATLISVSLVLIFLQSISSKFIYSIVEQSVSPKGSSATTCLTTRFNISMTACLRNSMEQRRVLEWASKSRSII